MMVELSGLLVFIWSAEVTRSTTLYEQINQLKQAIAEMEVQRAVPGNDAVDASIVPFQEKLAELEVQVGSHREILSRKRKPGTLHYMDVVSSTAIYSCSDVTGCRPKSLESLGYHFQLSSKIYAH